ncbi:PHB depolymerase family esterase [Terrarubrum flagellatum]|uniref:PHB depolymerase family esterase n=1 Tax=Terrirubrum flagellatum TaxID=2895980 RepID=UPI003144F6C7
MRRQPGHGDKLSYYDFGRTTVYACAYDQRFAYCLYVPDSYDEADDRRYDLLVNIHGTARNIFACREQFVALAEKRDVIVLVPLFPGGIEERGELSSYKMLRPGAVRYDFVLLAMIEEIAARYRLNVDRFALSGFSGGGHFAHRFLYLHPKRLSAVSIGAPGVVTLLDFDHDYWVGVRDFSGKFGRSIDLKAMRNVAVQMVIGGDDKETWEIAMTPKSPLWMTGADLMGGDRLERMEALKKSFLHHGIAVRHDVVPGVAHGADGLGPAVVSFFDEFYGARGAHAVLSAAGGSR